MAAKLSAKAKRAYVQYSKRMCTAVAVFWMVYRLLITLLSFFKPDVSSSFIRLTEGVDTVMIVNMGAYTANSSTEKIALAWTKRYQKDDDEEDEEDNGNNE